MDSTATDPNIKAREVMRDMAKRSHSMGKNLALVGAIFAGNEVCADCVQPTYQALLLVAFVLARLPNAKEEISAFTSKQFFSARPFLSKLWASLLMECVRM